MKQYFITLFNELLTHTEHKYIFFWWPINETELNSLSSDRWRRDAVLVHDEREIWKYLESFDIFFGPLAALCPRPLPKPCVVMLPDIQEQFYPEFFADDDLYIRDLHFPSSTRMADRVITLSNFSRDTLIYYYGLAEHKVLVAYPSPDPRFTLGERHAQWAGEELPRDYIFYPSNLWPHKNHDSLLQAMHILRRDRGLVIDALFTGQPVPGGYPLEIKAGEYDLADQVHWLGYRPLEEIIYLYRNAKMLVYPSLFEGFGFPIAEAMASDCPVAASHATCIPEITADAGLLFDPKSPESIARNIEQLWYDSELREQLSVRGRNRVKRFTPSQMVEAHLRAFHETQQSFSRARYMWNKIVYQHYHRLWAEIRRQRRSAVKKPSFTWGAQG